MSAHRHSIVLAVSLLAVACTDELPPLGQVLLYIDTDAPLPRAPQVAPTQDEVPALFDTLLIEGFKPGQSEPCEGCTRVVAPDAESARAAAISFGTHATPGESGYRVRLRLYDSASSLTGALPEPSLDGSAPQSVIDVTVVLPAVQEEGLVERTVFLPTDSVGVPIGSLEAPETTTAGPLSSSRVGSWSGAERLPCAGDPQPGEICVPGGAYWMGNPHARGSWNGSAADRRRLVVLSPFFMDATEVTVAQFRAWPEVATAVVGAWNKGTTGNTQQDFCTFTSTPDVRDGHPMVCLDHSTAAAFCQSRGAELPTEAQYEYVASGREGRLFVWGSALPRCEDAVVRRVGYGLFANLANGCEPPLPPGGSEPVGAFIDPPRRDRLELPTGVIFDLVANVAEWARDDWNRQQEECWHDGGAYRDPMCALPSPSDGALHTVRGGAWFGTTTQSVAAARIPSSDNASIYVGFRCVRPASPLVP